MSRSSQQTTHFRSTVTGPNPTQSASASAHQSGTVFTRVIPSSTKYSAVQVGRDSGLGSAVTTELASIKMTESGQNLVSNFSDSGSLASLSCEERYHTVMELPLQIETGTQSVTVHLSGHQSTAKSSLTVAEPLSVLSGQQSMPVQQAFVAEQQPLMSEQLLSMSSQIVSEGSAGASSSSLKYPTQVASASDMYGSLPDYLGTFSVSSASSFVKTAVKTAPSAADLEPCEDELDQIVIHKYEYKEEFKEGQFDIVLVYSESDRDEALAFREILINFVTLDDNRPLAICVLDQNVHLSYINSRFSHMEEALRRSTYMFLFLTKEFCGDSWAQLQRDECLMESIHNPEKRWCVVPILTKSRKEANYLLPFGLRALKGVEISHMLRGKTLSSVDVKALGPEDVDPFFLKNMKKMLNDRIYLRIEREKQQLVDFQNWLKEEKHRRWKKLQIEKFEKEVQDQKLKVERQTLQKELEHLKTQEIMAAEAEAGKAAEKEAAECICQLKTTKKERYSERLQPAVLNLVPDTGLIDKKATKEATTVEYHHHYYGPVSQGPAEQVVYKLYGPVSDSQIGSGNIQLREKEISDHVLLDETNLETDAPESIEYIVETEEASTPFLQDAGRDTSPVIMSDSVAAESDDTLEGMAEQKRTAVLSSTVGQALALSSSSKSMHMEKDEMTTGEEHLPEIDRPQSPPVLKSALSMLSHYWQPHGTNLAGGKSGSALGDSGTAQNPASSGTNMVDAGNSLQEFTTSGIFSNDPPVRPMAAVIPIRQKSLPEPNDEEEGEEMRLKVPCDDEKEEETKLKSLYLGETARSMNAETTVKHTGMHFCDRERLAIANEPCTKNQETVIVTRPETCLKPVLNSAQVCNSSVVLKKRVEQVEAHLTPGDVVFEVPGKIDASGTEQKSKPQVAVDLAESFAGSSSVDPVSSKSKNSDEKQVNIGEDCSNKSAFCPRSPGSTPSHKATTNPAAKNKSTCTVS